MPPTATIDFSTRTLWARKETPSCGDREKCPMPTGSQGLPIGLGVGIPIVAAIIICGFLHWRHLKNLKKEAENDRDFDAASVMYDEDGKGFAIESSNAVNEPKPPRTNYHQDFNQNDPFFDSPYILKGEGYSDNYSRSLTNLSAPYSGMPPPGSSTGLMNHSGFLASIGGDRYPSSPASSVFRAPHLNSSAASLTCAGTDVRKPAPTYQRNDPPPLPRMNASRPSLSNPNSPVDTQFKHNKQFSIGSVSDSELETPITEDPFDRESNIVNSPVVETRQTNNSQQSSFHTSQDSQDSSRASELSRSTTPDYDEKTHMDHAPSVPVPEVPSDSTSPPTQFDRIKSVYKVYFDENKEKAMREAVDEHDSNLTLNSEKELPDLPGNVTTDSFPADLTVDTEYSQMRNSTVSHSSSNYDSAPVPKWDTSHAAAARVPPGAPTNRAYAPVNALKIDFAPTTPDLSAVPHQHASPVGTSSPHSNWGTPPQDHYGFHGGAPAEAYFPQNASMPRRKPPPLQLKPLQTVPTPHKLDQSDLGVTSFIPSQKRVQTPTGSAPGSPVLSNSPSCVGFNPLHNPLHSNTDTEMMPSPHALRKSVSMASLDFAPPTRFGQGNSRNNSLTSQFTAGGTPIPQQRPTQVRSKMDTEVMLKPSWDMRH